MTNYHETVLVNEVIEALHIKNQANYIDATLGNGGHTLEILKLGGNVLGIEMDPKMLEIAKERVESAYPTINKSIDGNKFKPLLGNFKDIDLIVKESNWMPVMGILFDLGVTNLHLKSLERGFSFENPEAILDMRLNPETQGVKAADLLNVLREDQLEEMFKTVMEPGHARWITKRVVEKRSRESIKTVGEMLEICRGLKTGKSGINEATLPFLALRIAVNSELDNLETSLEKSFEILEKGGRLVVISFHSSEDEIVKDFFKNKNIENRAKVITFKPVMAGEEELGINRRARSAKMRILEK